MTDWPKVASQTLVKTVAEHLSRGYRPPGTSAPRAEGAEDDVKAATAISCVGVAIREGAHDEVRLKLSSNRSV